MTRYREPDLTRLRTVEIGSRRNAVTPEQFATPPGASQDFGAFLDSLPHLLAADHLRTVAAAIASAHQNSRSIVLLVGGHVIKTGLGPLLGEWCRLGLVTHLALNGAAAIHDWEVATAGTTSEDVEAGLADGSFGMAEETGREMNRAITAGREAGLGLGESLMLAAARAPSRPGDSVSLLLAAHRHGVPLTVHPALGAEIIHQHPAADGAAIGETALRDFRRLAGHLPGLHQGGVLLNLGSAVVLPEVFLKALAIARNLEDGRPTAFLAADFDMIRHYRPRMNVVERPTRGHGTGLQLTGHHELLVPLLAWAVQEALRRPE